MPAQKTLFLLRRPIKDPGESLLPLADNAADSASQSLVLMEEAVLSPPLSFAGQVYVLRNEQSDRVEASLGRTISYPELVSLIAEHDTVIVL